MIYIINKNQNPSYQLSWIIPVLVFPVFGALFYLFVETQPGTRAIDRRLKEIIKETGIDAETAAGGYGTSVP